MIEDAIQRNGLEHPDLRKVVYAIRKVENGRPELAFGIMDKRARTFDSQAGWCVCTVNKNWLRWQKTDMQTPFIVFLGNRYAPVGAENDPNNLNKNWIKNMERWLWKFDGYK